MQKTVSANSLSMSFYWVCYCTGWNWKQPPKYENILGTTLKIHFSNSISTLKGQCFW